MYIKINNEGAKKALVSISIMVIIIAFTSSVVVSLVPLSSVEGDRESNNPLGFKSIKKFDSNGKFITSWGSEGTGDGQFFRPEDVAVDSSSDNVFVADFEGNNIQKFDSNGNFITKWGSEGCNDGQFREHHGIDFDSIGNVYIVDTQNERIQKFDSNGKFITSWGSKGYGDGQFWLPHDIAIDSSDNVYVTDSGNVHEKKDNCTI
ncbi:MAG TPA: 6-bladed beta-propeller [Nitrososphaeraceae archaeon]|nr:6-bladed beta-propeller [Nitrososphaeraceae archaeon]